MGNATPLPFKAISINGQLFEGPDMALAQISPADRGLLLGDGLFETLPVLKGQALLWDRHRSRLMTAADTIGLALKADQLDGIVSQMERASDETPSILRLTVTRGIGGRGLLPPNPASPTIMATLAPLSLGFPFQDVRLVTSQIRRNEASPTSTIKALAYLDNILATKEAEAKGAGDALLLNSAGRVASTTIGNLFMVQGNHLITPPITDGVLPGILRQVLLEEAPKLGLVAEERSIDPAELKKADGLFLTNSLRIIRRVTRLDGASLGLELSPEGPASTDIIVRLQMHMQHLIKELTGVSYGQLP
ncbi:aminotransferase class IV [uncultured Cohaesibacter sp.]|uniref:aminotransferase class IV n=1 Tax=uncultured Cohaesibacter sp. TaxID=1002546 RepID=UPI0029C8147A|nr:aminotransferase class IV [uncultured Cohaesibacter sp.]